MSEHPTAESDARLTGQVADEAYAVGYADGTKDERDRCSEQAVRAVLAERERELLELKGPCSNRACRLHYAHAGPCDIPPERTSDG